METRSFKKGKTDLEFTGMYTEICNGTTSTERDDPLEVRQSRSATETKTTNYILQLSLMQQESDRQACQQEQKLRQQQVDREQRR